MSYHPRRALVLLPLLAALMLLGCAGDPTADGPSTTAADPAPASSSAPSTGAPSTGEPSTGAGGSEPTPADPAADPAPVPESLQFSATTVAGEPFDGASLAGQPVLLWFWAPWCPTCRSQIGEVSEIARTHQGTVQVVGVGSLDGGEAIEQFAADVPELTHLSDENGAVWRHFEVVEQSSFLLLDSDGETVLSVGYGGTADVAAAVADLARP